MSFFVSLVLRVFLTDVLKYTIVKGENTTSSIRRAWPPGDDLPTFFFSPSLTDAIYSQTHLQCPTSKLSNFLEPPLTPILSPPPLPKRQAHPISLPLRATLLSSTPQTTSKKSSMLSRGKPLGKENWIRRR
jgi:hypothetical protein